jgi:hypothetical protein
VTLLVYIQQECRVDQISYCRRMVILAAHCTSHFYSCIIYTAELSSNLASEVVTIGSLHGCRDIVEGTTERQNHVSYFG